jgi:hypothetical protein
MSRSGTRLGPFFASHATSTSMHIDTSLFHSPLPLSATWEPIQQTQPIVDSPTYPCDSASVCPRIQNPQRGIHRRYTYEFDISPVLIAQPRSGESTAVHHGIDIRPIGTSHATSDAHTPNMVAARGDQRQRCQTCFRRCRLAASQDCLRVQDVSEAVVVVVIACTSKRGAPRQHDMCV